MQNGEGTAIETETEKKEDEKKKKVRIRFSVFFDGTLNNRTNIKQRLAASSDDDLTVEELAVVADVREKIQGEDLEEAKRLYKENKPDEGDDSSYEGFYTNVEKMERYSESLSDPDNEGAEYHYKLATYIEGAGTEDKSGDSTKGFAFAKGKTGVEKKVAAGVADVVTMIGEKHFEKDEPIELITLDVFGFSRGAASARYFIHRALFDDTKDEHESIKQRLKNKGYKVGKVKVCFAGLYDTVSSYGYLLMFGSNNTEDLKLDAVSHAEEVVHLVASDEHRKYFSLTDIKSAGGKGREIYLPGVHSDIGGGYRDTGNEKQIVYRGFKNRVEADMKVLKDANWYRDGEIELEYLGVGHYKGRTRIAQLRVNRPDISSAYGRIVLHLMAKYARENEITFEGELDSDEAIPAELSSVQDKIHAYVAEHEGKGAYSSKASDWHDNERSWLNNLRHAYFHFSARIKMGHTPRIENGKRVRQTHAG